MTSVEPGSSWAERLNPRNWTLTWKLVVVGLVPALLALALGVLRIADDAGQATELGRSSRLVEVRDQVAGAANALRQERDESTLYVAGNRSGDRGVLEIGFGQTDGELDEMVNALRSTPELDPAAVAARQRAQEAIDRLTRLRGSVNGDPPIPYDQVVTRYSDIIGPIDALDRALLRQLRTPETAALADAITAVTGVIEQLSVEHSVIAAAIRVGRPLPGDATMVNAANAQLAAYYRDYQGALTPEAVARFGILPLAADNSRRDQLRTGILAAPFELQYLQADWDAAYAKSRGAADRTAEQIRTELIATSNAAENRASNLAGINSVILMLGLLVAVTIAVLVSRGLVRSLRVLRTSALDVADRRLPQTVESVRAGDTPDVTVAPVPLTGRDEVVQVARAFDAVHLQAIKLAADQAKLQAGVSAMFVNLSRRSQALVERQLQLIEQLEANEQDADQLSNLFQLDHLATRMRRNSENLLVLAGTDVAKRNVAAVPMVDVLRAAVSEVEQYQRIVVQAPPDATVLGRAASDIVHLLAELLDNATNFSPPDSQVVMSSTRTADGAIVVEIADRGVGMTDDELATANARLSSPASVDVTTSRRMGLIVVGRLATRHSVDVRLSSSSGGGSGSGLTASVTVPTRLVPTSEPRRAGALSSSGRPRQLTAPPPAPPQRPVRNGAVPPEAPLSALITGAEWPADPPAAGTGQPAGPPNGTVNGLPTRQPGAHLQAATAGFPSTPESRDPAAQPGAAASGEAEERSAERAERAAPAEPPADRLSEVADASPEQSGSAATHSRHAAAPAAEPDREGPAEPSAGDSPADVDPKQPASGRPGPARHSPWPTRSASPSPGTGDAAPTDADEWPPAGTGRQPGIPEPAAARSADRSDREPVADGDDTETGPRTDPTPAVGQPRNLLPQRRPSPGPQRRPAPQPFAPLDGPDRMPTDPWERPAVSPGGLFASQVPAPVEPAPVEPAPVEPAPVEPAPVEPAMVEPAMVEPDPAGPADAPLGPMFDPNETTPIFEEIASAWFRSNRSVPVQYASTAPEPSLAPPVPAAEPMPAQPVGSTRPPVVEPVAAELVGADRGFASLADEGWRAARGMTTARGDELTPAGLPKRRPRARLVPGSAGSAVLAPLAAPSRNAESVRGRLASYQQGVRRGRESRLRGDAEPDLSPTGAKEQANAQGNQDEESS